MRPARVEIASATTSLRCRSLFVLIARVVFPLGTLLLNDDSAQFLVLVGSEQHLVIEKIVERGVEEFLGELGVVNLPVFDAEREQTQLPRHQKHVGYREVSSPSRVANGLEEANEGSEVALLGVDREEDFLRILLVAECSNDLGNHDDFGRALGSGGFDDLFDPGGHFQELVAIEDFPTQIVCCDEALALSGEAKCSARSLAARTLKGRSWLCTVTAELAMWRKRLLAKVDR